MRPRLGSQSLLVVLQYFDSQRLCAIIVMVLERCAIFQKILAKSVRLALYPTNANIPDFRVVNV